MDWGSVSVQIIGPKHIAVSACGLVPMMCSDKLPQYIRNFVKQFYKQFSVDTGNWMYCSWEQMAACSAVNGLPQGMEKHAKEDHLDAMNTPNHEATSYLLREYAMAFRSPKKVGLLLLCVNSLIHTYHTSS